MKHIQSWILVIVAAWFFGCSTPQNSTEDGTGRPPLELKYLGTAGWEISDGNVVVLIDPYISRLKYGGGGHPDDDRPDFARNDIAQSDTALIDRTITRADFILVHHGHFAHLGDVPYIAAKTGAKVIGTETTMGFPKINFMRSAEGKIICSMGFRCGLCLPSIRRWVKNTISIQGVSTVIATSGRLCGSISSLKADH